MTLWPTPVCSTSNNSCSHRTALLSISLKLKQPEERTSRDSHCHIYLPTHHLSFCFCEWIFGALAKAKPFACALDLIPSGVMKGLQHALLTLQLWTFSLHSGQFLATYKHGLICPILYLKTSKNFFLLCLQTTWPFLYFLFIAKLIKRDVYIHISNASPLLNFL